MRKQLCLFLLLLVQVTFAQKSFVNGYVVTLSQDTLRGKILHEDWEITPVKIEFLSSDNKKFSYLPVDIKAFHIELKNEVYVSKTLKLDYFWQSEIAENQKALLETKTDAIFLRLLLKGDKASLYQFNDRDNRIRFFSEKDDNMVELINYVYKKRVDTESANKLIEFRKEIYKSQLPFICQDAPKSIFKRLPMYEQSSMMDFFNKYNACFLGDRVEYSTKKDKLKWAVAPSLGIFHYPDLMMKDVDLRLLDYNWRATYGISVQMFEPRKNYNRFVRVDAQLIPAVKYYVYNINQFNTYVVKKRSNINIALLGGSYFGKADNRIQPYGFAGMIITPASILFDLGGGIAFKKKLHLEFNTCFFKFYQTSIKYNINLSK